MTAADAGVRSNPPPVLPETTVDRVARICPYLVASDGAWRSATAAREHRCGAVTPPEPVAAQMQRRLCLTPNHPTCSTFEAARAARPVGPDRLSALPRPMARTTPVVLDHGRVTIAIPRRLPARSDERSRGQAVLIVLMAVAFGAVILAKLTSGGTAAVASDASPSGAAPAVVASVAPSATARVRVASPAASAAPSASAATAAPSNRTYKVKAGDTIVGIAAKFGTTSKAISKLNGITDATNLKVGQTLKIP